jgi:pimeloyl-ACP methyl ester carboxylesterase
MKHIAVGGQAIAVELSGAGRPLVLLHGLGADRSQVRTALPPPDGFQCVYPDLPGHGETPLQVGAGEIGFDRFATLLRGVLDRLEIERAVIGGISMGAAIALRFALEAPERVAGMVLIRPSWLDGPARPHLEIVERVGHWQERLPKDAEALLESDPDYADLRNVNPQAAQSVRGLLTRRQAREGARVLGAMVADRPFARLDALGGITCKALVVANEGDPLHPIYIGRTLAVMLAHARLQMIPSRYLAPAEHLTALRGEVGQFLDQLGEY